MGMSGMASRVASPALGFAVNAAGNARFDVGGVLLDGDETVAEASEVG
jgi:hypothetical protein